MIWLHCFTVVTANCKRDELGRTEAVHLYVKSRYRSSGLLLLLTMSGKLGPRCFSSLPKIPGYFQQRFSCSAGRKCGFGRNGKPFEGHMRDLRAYCEECCGPCCGDERLVEHRPCKRNAFHLPARAYTFLVSMSEMLCLLATSRLCSHMCFRLM
jgi:hypothetical protein